MSRWIALALVLAACGDRTSVPEDRRLDQLDSHDLATLCVYLGHIGMEGVHTIKCDGQSVELNLPTLDNCELTVFTTCPATVGDWLDCEDDWADDLCAGLKKRPDSCAALDACYSGW